MQMTIQRLQNIIDMAKGFKELDSSLSDTIEFELLKEKDTHLGSDTVRVLQKSAYGECNGKYLFMTP